MKHTPSLEDQIITLYCLVDDLLHSISLPTYLGNDAGRKPSLTDTEIITCALLQSLCSFRTKKGCYNILSDSYRHLFPSLPSYKNYVMLTNSRSALAAQVLLILCHIARTSSNGEKYIDATPLPVCKNKRIHCHQVCDGYAKRGKTTTGWFYGFKLHIVSNNQGHLLSLQITPGNTDDRKTVKNLCSQLSGLVIGDAGYLSKELQEELQENNVHLFTAVRNNMKKLMTTSQHQLLKKRQRVESVFNVLKENLGMACYRSRSLLGHMARYTYSLLAYAIKTLFQANVLKLGVS